MISATDTVESLCFIPINDTHIGPTYFCGWHYFHKEEQEDRIREEVKMMVMESGMMSDSCTVEILSIIPFK